MSTALAVLYAHPELAPLLALVALSVVAGLVPTRYHSRPWYGALLAAIARLSALTPPDAAGTFKLPGARVVLERVPATRAGDERVTPLVPPPPRGSGGFATPAALFTLAVAVALAVALGVLAGGCGARQRPWTDTAQIALNTGAHALAVVDSVAAARYRAEAADASALAPLEARYQPVLMAERVAAASLRAAEGALDIARATPTAAAKCRAGAAIEGAAADAAGLARELRIAGLAVPPEIDAVADAARDVTMALAPTCAADGSVR